MERFLGHSPPFRPFLIGTLNTGRVMVNEKCKMDGAYHSSTDSG